MQPIANVNGKICPAAAATISINDRGFLYGDSIYEVVRTYEGIPFFHEEHLDRLENSARLAKMPLSQSRTFLKNEILRTVEASGAAQSQKDVFIRYTISRGIGPLDLDPATASETSYIILVKEIPAWNPRFFSEGVKLAIPPTRRNPPLALDPNIKSGNYLNNILAVAEAKEAGADDALLLSIDGHLTECSNSNINFIKNGKVYSPLHQPRTVTGNLRGLTRMAVEKVSANAGLAYEELPLMPDFILTAEECFVSSATREVMPVVAIRLENGEWKKFPGAAGRATQALQKAYANFLQEYRRENSASSLWATKQST